MIEKRRKKFDFTNQKILTKFLYVNFIVLLPVCTLYFHLKDKDLIINSFNTNKLLICDLKDIVIEVNKADKWEIRNSYFIAPADSFGHPARSIRTV